eukprot:1190899-Prorocentrum_minimum.AAC.3
MQLTCVYSHAGPIRCSYYEAVLPPEDSTRPPNICGRREPTEGCEREKRLPQTRRARLEHVARVLNTSRAS